MKKIYIAIFVCAVIIGCASPHKEYVIATNDAVEAIAPCYTEYINADAKLKDFDKKARTKAVNELLQMTRQERKRVE